MLNKKEERELCYVARVDDIRPIEGKDRVECAVIGGWTVMVRKGQFHPGDLGIYFEIDSKVPEKEPFLFLSAKKYKVKTQKYGNFYSQGLLMAAEDFGWTKTPLALIEKDDTPHYVDDETRFLTKHLGVIYEVPEDNGRKVSSVDKYQKMAQRHFKLFAHFPFNWLMRHNWGKKLLFFFFPQKKKNNWPSHICSKSDVERVQNMIWVLNNKEPYVATEKVDGCSFTCAIERKGMKYKQYVCSRNVVFSNRVDKCFYEKNIYWEAYDKYNLGEIITQILNDYKLPNLAIQAEIFGDGVQKRNYSMTNGQREIRVFHMVSNEKKFPMDKTVEICEKYGLPHVHIVDDNYILPDTLEELQNFVESEGSEIDGKPREGIVFYDKATGQQYFKFVSPEFLMKYHGKGNIIDILNAR